MTHADDSTIASSVDGLSLDDKGNKFAKHADKCTSEENCACNNHSNEGEEKEKEEEKSKEGNHDESGVLDSKGGGDEEKDAKRSRGDGSGKEKMPGIKNNALQNIDDCTKGLMMSQMRDPTVSVEGEGLMPMLRSCLESNLGRSSVAVISGAIEHFESKKDVDHGWGCGWRNIQMLCSYLLSEDAEVREVLFGSAGFVPDIPALQMWLEIAWAKGFDVSGGESFDWKIRGTNKWIGATEGAALLRSFGARAQIVDFQATGGKRGSGDMRSKTGQQKNSKTAVESDNGDEDDSDDESQFRNNNPSEDEGDDEKEAEAEDDETLNPNPKSKPSSSGGNHRREPSEVECAVCGEHQLKDSQIRRDLWHSGDVCSTCSQNSSQTCQNSNPNPWKEDEKASDSGRDRQISGHQRAGWDKKTGSGGSEEGSTSVKHKQMVDWIWSFFTGEILDRSQGEGPDSTIILSQRSPLYFQHQGHSQTIIGVERRRTTSPPPEQQHFDDDKDNDDNDDVYLLVLDPSQQTERILQRLQEKQGWEKLIKRGLRTLKQTEYQLCYVDRGVANGEEYENLKILTSHSYTY